MVGTGHPGTALVACRRGALALALTLGWSVAADPLPPAEELLRSMSSFYRKAESLSFDASSTYSHQVNGLLQKTTTSCSVLARRPNLIFLKTPHQTLMSDGKTLTVFYPGMKSYRQTNAPLNLDDLPGQQGGFAAGLTGGGGEWAMILLSSNPMGKLMEHADGVSYADVAPQSGKPEAHCLEIKGKHGTMALWISKGAEPLLLKAESTYAASAGASAAGRLVVTFSKWAVDKPVAAETFTFQPPEGAKEVTASKQPSGQYIWGQSGRMPAGPEAFTEAKRQALCLEWNRTYFADAYRRHGSHDPAWDKAANAFFNAICVRFSGDRSDKLCQALIRAASAMVKRGCTDPLVRYCYGNLLDSTEGARAAYPLVRDSVVQCLCPWASRSGRPFPLSHNADQSRAGLRGHSAVLGQERRVE